MKTVVLLSGGVDSAVTLAMAVAAGDDIHSLTVDYGQRHARELASANRVAAHYGVPQRVVTIDPVLFRGSALTGGAEFPAGHATGPDATYVPARNTVLLALAAAYAESLGAGMVVIGANSDDAAGYPDCRPAYLEAFRDVLQEGTRTHVWVNAPLLYMSETEILHTARQMGVPLDLTWSCYAGGDEPCGVCGACAVTT